MSVDELAQEQLEELRDSYFHQLVDGGDEEVLDGIDRAEDIPMDNVKAHYEGVYFVEDDFFCSMGEDPLPLNTGFSQEDIDNF